MVDWIRRFAMGCVWFVIFWAGLSFVGGGVAGAMASQKMAQTKGTPQEHFEKGFQLGQAAGAEFHRRYGRAVMFAAVVLALGGTVTGVLPGTGRTQ